MEGEEASLFALTDGHAAVALGVAQDHKTVFDDDRGPNTGGMGAYAPAPAVDAAMERQVMDEIVRPVLAAMAAEGTPYTGVLFVGLMLTAAGPRVVEFNCRFGDPECQVLLPLLDGRCARPVRRRRVGRGLAGPAPLAARGLGVRGDGLRRVSGSHTGPAPPSMAWRRPRRCRGWRCSTRAPRCATAAS